MTERLVLDDWNDWLLPGSLNDTRLHHADETDRILVCPPHLGQGYVQHIPLCDDMTLVILDYTLHQEIMMEASGSSNRIEFTFYLAGSDEGYSFFCPHFGLKQLNVKQKQNRFFKVEIFFKPPAFSTYFQSFMERLTPQTQDVANRILQFIHRRHRKWPSTVEIKPGTTFEQLLTDTLYAEAIALNYATRQPITPAMEQVIGHILSCPYQGATRRAYLGQKALELVGLRLDAMTQPDLSEDELESIHQAAAILRKQVASPPTIEMLARQVGTNRLKLNQGFHDVFGTTPYGYLRDCRVWQARWQLMMLERSVNEVAASVGYTSRSRFATAFRQQMGMNPKMFQMQAWGRDEWPFSPTRVCV